MRYILLTLAQSGSALALSLSVLHLAGANTSQAAVAIFAASFFPALVDLEKGCQVS